MIDSSTPLFHLTVGQYQELLRAEKARPEPPKQELPMFQTPIQLSLLIGWKLTTVYQNHHAGLIPGAKKVGGKLLFDTKVILAWIEEKSIPTREERVRALSNRKGRS